jgi:hypothetical protein
MMRNADVPWRAMGRRNGDSNSGLAIASDVVRTPPYMAASRCPTEYRLAASMRTLFRQAGGQDD